MLAASYLYSLTPRPGAPADGFGLSHAANDDYHVVGNPFLQRQPENGFSEKYRFTTRTPGNC